MNVDLQLRRFELLFAEHVSGIFANKSATYGFQKPAETTNENVNNHNSKILMNNNVDFRRQKYNG